MPMQCFIHVKGNFEKKNPVLPIGKFPFFVLSRNARMLQQRIGQAVANRRLKIKENFKLLALNVVSVAYKMFQI